MSSTLHMPYDDPPYYFVPSRELPEYDMAAALDISPQHFSRQVMADHYDGFAPTMLDPQPFAPTSFPPQYPPEAISAYHPAPSPHMQHPIPRRPISPEMLFHQGHAWEEEARRSSLYAESSRSSFSSEDIHQPSMFAPLPESSTTHSVQQEPAEPPQPPPSWSMSGSLDPATGIYQTAPEHPRVRTQQACEKCRSRKAKCTGERPCQRCLNRGLQCEYAPERKMRGPNKVKRKSAMSSTSRRASIASSISSMTTTSSEDDSFYTPSPKSTFSTEPRQFTMKLDSMTLDAPPPEVDSRAYASGSSSLAASPRSDNHLQPPSPLDRSRPPPINLSGTSLYDQAPVPLSYEVPLYGFDAQSASQFRRASLPSHVLEYYTRRGGRPGEQAVYAPPRGLSVVETTPRPRSSPAYPSDTLAPALSLFPTSHSSGSSSGHSLSTPITPISVVPLGALEGELSYPLDFSSTHDGFLPDLGSFARFGDVSGPWDMDATPTLHSEGHEKGFPMLENELVGISEE